MTQTLREKKTETPKIEVVVESYHEYTHKGSTREKVTHTECVELPDYTTYLDASDEVPENLFPRHSGNTRVCNW